MYVSVSEIKAHFAKYLKLMQQGETVIITSHHQPLAQLQPIATYHAKELFKNKLNCKFTWDGKKPKGASIQVKISGKTAADRILEDRG